MLVRNEKYLKIIGTLYPDNRLDIRTSYLTDRPRRVREDPKGSISVKLYDEKKKLLLVYRLSTRNFLVQGKYSPNKAVRGEVPFPANTTHIHFYKGEVLIHEIHVPKEKPIVKITWDPPRMLKGKENITWESGPPRNDIRINYFMRYTCNSGETWQRVGWRTDKTEIEIDFDDLPGGKDCKLAIVATDGVNTTIEKSKSFSVPIKPCQALILEPENETKFKNKERVILRGQGFYMEEHAAETEELLWVSSIDGKLGKGMVLELSDLSLGHHEITLFAGKKDREGKKTIRILIEGDNKE